MASRAGEAPLGAATGADAAPRARTAALLVEAMRLRHWLKNAFVLGAVVFSGHVLHLGDEWRAWTVALAFCLASSAAYLVNDVIDAEADRHNPRTAQRPIARGDLAPRVAIVAAAGLAAAALGLAAVVNWESLAVLGGFIVLQLAYSTLLKHVLFVDVMAIAAAFVLRALGGLMAIDVGVSEWVLLATGLLALFLGLAKRRGEAVALGGTAHPQRPVLEAYSIALIDELIAVITPSVVMVYALYAVLGARTNLMLLTVPYVIYGIFRVLYLVHARSALTEEPAVVVWRDLPLLVCVASWGITAAAISLAYPQ
jgi:4-hydroxybenzoate polyprenyltransferase